MSLSAPCPIQTQTKNRTPVFGCTASPLLYTLRSRVVNRSCDRPLRRWSTHILLLPAPPALAPATTLVLPSQRSKMPPRIQCAVVWIGLLVLQSLAVQLIERLAHVVGVVVDELRDKPAYRAPNPARVSLDRLHDRVILETAHLISHGHPHHLSPRTLARTSRRCASACSSSAQQLGSSSVSRVVICRYRVAASIRSRMTPASSALVGIPSQAWTQAAMRWALT